MSDDAALDLIRNTLGAKGVIEQGPDLEPYLTESRGLWRGSCDLVAKPADTAETAAVVKICHDHRIPVVPLGGNTGLVRGGIPDGGIVLSTERMTRIRDIDATNSTLTCDAGCVLADIQAAARDCGRFFPLSLGAEGSCRIGGNLSTNAGGVQVLRYGNARDLVLGIEVVLPDGRVWDGLRGLRKDNTGYDLKHLFIGAEGTLGVITAAVLKLFPDPVHQETALATLPTADSVIELFSRANGTAGDSLSAFECMNRFSVELAVRHVSDVRHPFTEWRPWYVLMELSSPGGPGALRESLETVLGEALEDGVVADAVVAVSSTQTADIWRIREGIPEAQGHEGASIKNDITVPISCMVEFLAETEAAVRNFVPGIRFVTFGHIGDGNLHYNLTQPEGMASDAFLDLWHDATRIVNDRVEAVDGSFSAEHGIGSLKRDDLKRYRPAVEVDLMRAVNRAIDPNNIMNPGKVLPDE